MNSSTDLKLSTLPPDVIRTIINSHAGKAKNNMRLISKTWQLLVVEYVESLPPISLLEIVTKNSKLSVYITVERKYKNYFAQVHPNCWKMNSRKKTHVRIVFDVPMGSDSVLSAFQFTNHIKYLTLKQLNQNAMPIICKVIRDVNIGLLSLYEPILTEDLSKMIRRHQIPYVWLYSSHISKNCLNEYLQSVSKTAKMVMVITDSINEMTTEESKTYWDSVSEQLIKKETVELIRIDSGNDMVCLRIDPFLNFMHNFRFYCFDK